MTPFVSQCAWCRRVKQADGSFAATIIPSGALVSHGMCPDCFDSYEMPVLAEPFQVPREADVYGDAVEVSHG